MKQRAKVNAMGTKYCLAGEQIIPLSPIPGDSMGLKTPHQGACLCHVFTMSLPYLYIA